MKQIPCEAQKDGWVSQLQRGKDSELKSV